MTGAGKQRRVNQSIRWEGSGTAAITAAAAGPRAHFVIAIPDDAPETSDDHPNDEIVWRLSASADVHGRRFKAFFTVPVFRMTPANMSTGQHACLILDPGSGS